MLAIRAVLRRKQLVLCVVFFRNFFAVRTCSFMRYTAQVAVVLENIVLVSEFEIVAHMAERLITTVGTLEKSSLADLANLSGDVGFQSGACANDSSSCSTVNCIGVSTYRTSCLLF